MFAALLLILEMATIAAWGRRVLKAEIEHDLSAYIRKVHDGTRSGLPLAIRRTPRLTPGAKAVGVILQRAEALGRPLVPTLVAFERELRRAKTMSDDCRRLWRLFYGRTTFVLAIAVSVRFWLIAMSSADLTTPWLTVEDGVALIIALALIAIGQIWLVRSLPVSWLKGRPISIAGLAWLRSHSTLHVEDGFRAPWVEPLAAIRRRQILHGVNLEPEVRRLLGDWAKCQATDVQLSLKKLEDALPLMELSTIGIPAALLLAVPLLLGSSA